MRSLAEQLRGRVVEYDRLQHRVWILGQRCHHGATGSVVAALAFCGLITERPRRPLVVLAASGGILMVHDWKDHSVWFQRGRGAQP